MSGRTGKVAGQVGHQFEYAQQNPNFLNPNGANEPYVTYSVLLTQTGTDNPIVNILRNTFKSDPTVIRTGVGQYEITLNNSFPSNQVAIVPGTLNIGTGARLLMAERQNDNMILIRTSIDGAYSDDVLDDTFLEIRTYL